MKLLVKNMCCIHCKILVELILEDLGIDYLSIEIGKIELNENISKYQREKLNLNLQKFGLELAVDRKTALIENIKNEIIYLIYNADENDYKVNFTEHLSSKFNHEYHFLTN